MFFALQQYLNPQQIAISGGSLVMLSSGMHIGFGFFHWDDVDVPWTKFQSSSSMTLAIIQWFLGSIIGFCTIPLAVKYFGKPLIYLIANVLIAISAILLITMPQYFYAVFFSRLVAGVAHGLAYVVVIHHFGEIASDNQRGRIGTAIHLFTLKGGIISGTAVIKFFSQEGRMDVNRFLGIVSLTLSVIAVLITIFLYIESPLRLIEHGEYEEALGAIMILRKEQVETPETLKCFCEIKTMALEDKRGNSNIFTEGNVHPLIVVLMLRIAFVLTFNYGLKQVHITTTKISISGIDYTFILNLIHTLTVVIVMFTIDKGRRKHFFISAVGTSLIFILLGHLRWSEFTDSNWVIFAAFAAFELFSAMAMGLTANIYSTEAFATAKKARSIAFTSIIEQLLQIVMIIVAANYSNAYWFDAALMLSSGIILAMIGVYLYQNLPETRNLSIRETRNEFLK